MCSYNGVTEKQELTVLKSDTVQILDTKPPNMYWVRRDCVESGRHDDGWLPAYVIGMRNQLEEESRSR